MDPSKDTRPTFRISTEDWEVFHQTYSGCLIDSAMCRTFQYNSREWTCVSVYYSHEQYDLSAYQVETVPPTTKRINTRKMMADSDYRYTGMVLQVEGENRRVQLISGQTRFIYDPNIIGPQGRQLQLFTEAANG
jgi:hypothetical protein